MKIILGVGGGIAAYKAAVLARLLVADGADVHVLMTAAGARFVGPDTFAALTRNPVHRDLFEGSEHVLHVRLAHQADVAGAHFRHTPMAFPNTNARPSTSTTPSATGSRRRSRRS